jgi:hypothetical protein
MPWNKVEIEREKKKLKLEAVDTPPATASEPPAP